MYAYEEEYPAGKAELETEEMSGVRKGMLGNTEDEDTDQTAECNWTMYGMRIKKGDDAMSFIAGAAVGYIAGVITIICIALAEGKDDEDDRDL